MCVLCIKSHELPPDIFQQTFNAYKVNKIKYSSKSLIGRRFVRTLIQQITCYWNLQKNQSILQLKISFIPNQWQNNAVFCSPDNKECKNWEQNSILECNFILYVNYLTVKILKIVSWQKKASCNLIKHSAHKSIIQELWAF